MGFFTLFKWGSVISTYNYHFKGHNFNSNHIPIPISSSQFAAILNDFYTIPHGSKYLLRKCDWGIYFCHSEGVYRYLLRQWPLVFHTPLHNFIQFYCYLYHFLLYLPLVFHIQTTQTTPTELPNSPTIRRHPA